MFVIMMVVMIAMIIKIVMMIVMMINYDNGAYYSPCTPTTNYFTFYLFVGPQLGGDFPIQVTQYISLTSSRNGLLHLRNNTCHARAFTMA